MALSTQIAALASAMGADIKALLARALPPGGATGQVLTKASAADYDAAWQTASAGGGGASVYIQEADPLAATPYIWFRTDAMGVVIDILKG